MFCPTCGTSLLIDSQGPTNYFCQACPYTYQIKKPIKREAKIIRKQVEDVLGDSWGNTENSESTVCPRCERKGAMFFQMQIRSADEPMTTFYKCDKKECGHSWNDGGR
eukprot:gb/GEZN01021995.1/.p1 GENE.gb/GEZN01021995.1/~~gb/GEZN01021995.1/.p1  ORF type:complete len:108 (-),score=3.10 gb/GEZN01021995.1/:255-578(-)